MAPTPDMPRGRGLQGAVRTDQLLRFANVENPNTHDDVYAMHQYVFANNVALLNF